MSADTITSETLYQDYEQCGLFNQKQLYYLQLGLQEGFDTSIYADKAFSWKQMEQILFGLRARIDVSVYAKDFYSEYQMAQIRAALEHGLSMDKIQIFLNPTFDEWQMCQIRVGLEVGIDATLYADPSLSWQQMRKQYDKLCVEKHRLDDIIKQASEDKRNPFEESSRIHEMIR